MKFEVVINRNTITLTVEKVTVDASSVTDAVEKAVAGDYLEIEIVEVNDVVSLSDEVESVKHIAE
jgi:hypothetical protein